MFVDIEVRERKLQLSARHAVQKCSKVTNFEVLWCVIVVIKVSACEMHVLAPVRTAASTPAEPCHRWARPEKNFLQCKQSLVEVFLVNRNQCTSTLTLVHALVIDRLAYANTGEMFGQMRTRELVRYHRVNGLHTFDEC